MAESRKLAAILAADVARYSKLAAADKERTLARLRALRSDLFDPTIALHHGRVVKRMGDGVLIEFRSVVDAVRCAIEVQNGMVERHAGLPPERRIELRVVSISRTHKSTAGRASFSWMARRSASKIAWVVSN
jgi:adenylate cyclase